MCHQCFSGGSVRSGSQGSESFRVQESSSNRNGTSILHTGELVLFASAVAIMVGLRGPRRIRRSRGFWDFRILGGQRGFWGVFEGTCLLSGATDCSRRLGDAHPLREHIGVSAVSRTAAPNVRSNCTSQNQPSTHWACTRRLISNPVFP